MLDCWKSPIFNNSMFSMLQEGVSPDRASFETTVQTTTAPFSLVFNCWKPLAAFNGCKLIPRKRAGAFLEAAASGSADELSR